MTIAKEVGKTVKEDRRGFLKDAKTQRMQDYYLEMKKLGFAKKQEYTLPQLDTVGICCYNR